MALLSGTAEIECVKCGKSFHIDAADLDVDQVGADDRQMGMEIFYAGEVTLNCPKCRCEIEIGYEASEYPIGAPNYSDTNAKGARIIRGFADIEVHFEEELYSFEEKSLLYLPEEKKIITNLCDGLSELIVEINRKPSIIFDVDPRKFEDLIAHIFSQEGFRVELTKRTRDGGRDIIAIRSDLGIRSKYIIECKRYAPNRPVSVGLVRALYGVQMQEGANKSILATTSRFTQDAKAFASKKTNTEWHMDLKAFNDILQWVGSAAARNEKT